MARLKDEVGLPTQLLEQELQTAFCPFPAGWIRIHVLHAECVTVQSMSSCGKTTNMYSSVT